MQMKTQPAIAILVLLVSTVAVSEAKVYVQHPGIGLAHRLAHRSTLDQLLETGAALNDLVWFANDPHLYWQDCTPINSVQEKIQTTENHTDLFLSVSQPCQDLNVPLKDFHLSVDQAHRLSVSANVTSGDTSSFSKQYQLPTLAAADLISATYTADRVLHILIPHLSPSDLSPSPIPVAVEPEPETQPPQPGQTDPVEEAEPTKAHAGGVAPKTQNKETSHNTNSNHLQDVNAADSKTTEKTSATQPPPASLLDESATDDMDARLREALKQYEAKIQAYSEEIARLASIHSSEAHKSAETSATQTESKQDAEQPYYLQVETDPHVPKPSSDKSPAAPVAQPGQERRRSDPTRQEHVTTHDSKRTPSRVASPAAPAPETASSPEPKPSPEQKSGGRKAERREHEPKTQPIRRASAQTDKSKPATQPCSTPASKEPNGQDKGPQPNTHLHQQKQSGPQRKAARETAAEGRGQRERVGRREKLATQEDAYRPVPTKRAVREAEAASGQERAVEDVKGNVARLEDEIRRLRDILSAQ